VFLARPRPQPLDAGVLRLALRPPLLQRRRREQHRSSAIGGPIVGVLAEPRFRNSSGTEISEGEQRSGLRVARTLLVGQQYAASGYVQDVEIVAAEVAHCRCADGKTDNPVQSAGWIKPTKRPIINQRTPIVSFRIERGSVREPRACPLWKRTSDGYLLFRNQHQSHRHRRPRHGCLRRPWSDRRD
jgi:hypothetical protein